MIRPLLAIVLALAASPPGASASVPRFGKVFVIVGENTSYAQVTAERAPYLVNTMRPRGAWLTGYRAFSGTKSLANYIGMLSGQYTACEARDDDPATCHQGVDNLFSQLARTRRTWRVWAEAMPAPCRRTDSAGGYVAHHN